MGVLTGCKPRKEVLKGDLDDAIFAADFGDLIAGKAPAVYGNAAAFFQNTHPAKQLCKVVQDIFSCLVEKKEGGVWKAARSHPLRAAVRANAGPAAKLTPGAFYALDPVEAAWWFGLMERPSGKRARRALRILVEAVR